MTRLIEYLVAFLAGIAVALVLADRLLGGDCPVLEIYPFAEPYGDL